MQARTPVAPIAGYQRRESMGCSWLPQWPYSSFSQWDAVKHVKSSILMHKLTLNATTILVAMSYRTLIRAALVWIILLTSTWEAVFHVTRRETIAVTEVKVSLALCTHGGINGAGHTRFLATNCSSKITSFTHWGRDKMSAISQTTFSNLFSWMKMNELRLRFHWSLVLRSELTIFQHWFR